MNDFRSFKIHKHEQGKRKEIYDTLDHNQVAFLTSKTTFDYIVLDSNDFNELKTYEPNTLFELTTDNRELRLYADFDNKGTDKPNVSYKQINNHIAFLKDLFKVKYSIDKAEFYVLISINAEDRNKKFNINEPFIKSFHLTSNLRFKSKEHMKQLITNIYEGDENEMSKYFDRSVYSKTRLMRAIYQAKGYDKNTKKTRTDLLVPFTSDNDYCYEYTGDYFLGIPSKTFRLNRYIISNTDKTYPVEVDLELEQQTINTQSYNIKYVISSHNKLEKWIDRLNIKPANSGTEWFFRLNTFIGVLKWIDTTEDNRNRLANKFLNVNREPTYSTQEHINNDETLLMTSWCNRHTIRNTNKDLFIEPTDKEVEFIYTNLGIANTEPTEWLVISINKQPFLQNIQKPTLYYDIKKKILITEGYIVKEPVKELNGEDKLDKKGNRVKKSVLKKLNDTAEVNYNTIDITTNIETIRQTEIKDLNKLHNVRVVDIHSWGEVTASNKNEFNCGACGSRKTSLRMLEDIEYALKDPNARIVMPKDLISISSKTFCEFTERYGDIVCYYKNKKQPYNPDKHRIMVVCINSLMLCSDYNFTHIFIDEVKNVLHRLETIDNLALKSDVMELLTKYLTNSVVKLYDADKDYLTLKQLELYGLLNNRLTINNLVGYIQKNNLIEVRNEMNAIQEIVKHLLKGHKITISCSYQEYAKNLFNTLSNNTNKKGAILCGIGSIGVIHKAEGITDTKFKEVMSSNANEEWNKYDFLIWTSSITTGISYDKQDFYKHYAFIGEIGENSTQASQMLFRARDTKTHTISMIPIRNALATINDNHSRMNHSIQEHNNLQHSKSIQNKDHIPTYQNLDTYKKGLNALLETLNKTNKSVEVKISMIHNHIKASCKVRKFREVLINCLLWGCNVINSNVFECVYQEHIHTKLDMNDKCLNWTDMDKEAFVKCKMLTDNELTELNDSLILTTEQTRNIEFTYRCKSLGYSQYFINAVVEKEGMGYLYDFRFNPLESDQTTYIKTYHKTKLLLNYEFKDLFYFIYEKGFRNEDTIEHSYTQNRITIYYYYVVFKVFDIMGMTHDKLVNFLSEPDNMTLEKTGENLQMLCNLFTEVEDTIKFIKKNDTTNNRIRGKINELTDYKKITLLLTKPFGYFGVNVALGRQTPQKKTDKVIQFIMEDGTFKVQQKRYLINSNETDDIERMKENADEYIDDIRAKIRLPTKDTINNIEKQYRPYVDNINHYEGVVRSCKSKLDAKLCENMELVCNLNTNLDYDSDTDTDSNQEHFEDKGLNEVKKNPTDIQAEKSRISKLIQNFEYKEYEDEAVIEIEIEGTIYYGYNTENTPVYDRLLNEDNEYDTGGLVGNLQNGIFIEI